MTETEELQKKKKQISLLSDQVLSLGPSVYKCNVLSTSHTAALIPEGDSLVIEPNIRLYMKLGTLIEQVKKMIKK